MVTFRGWKPRLGEKWNFEWVGCLFANWLAIFKDLFEVGSYDIETTTAAANADDGGDDDDEHHDNDEHVMRLMLFTGCT